MGIEVNQMMEGVEESTMSRSEEVIISRMKDLESKFELDEKNEELLEFILENESLFKNKEYSLAYRAECFNILAQRILFMLEARKRMAYK